MPGIVETIFMAAGLMMFGWGYIKGHKDATAKAQAKTVRIMERMLNH